MDQHYMDEAQIAAFKQHLIQAERGQGTIEKYLRDLRMFRIWLNGQEVTKEAVIAWKLHLLESGLRPETVNSKLSALNGFFAFLGWTDCRVHYLKIQRKLFRDKGRELTREEYMRLLEAAQDCGQERLALLMETICAVGLRVSEIQYITVEAVRDERVDVFLKGKIRTILLPGKLCRKLERYIKKQDIVSGAVFVTKSGRVISRRQVWAEMKALCRKAGVMPGKVFPHNLRHLFARTFYRIYKDVARLADVLGHSSIETTRIYLISTGAEHARQIEQLGLIC